MQTISFLTYIDAENNSYLSNTLNSLKNQKAKLNGEYIFIANGLDNQALENIRHLISQNLSNTTLLTNNDTITAKSIKKGISITSGKYLFFLRSGDYLPDELTQLILNCLQASSNKLSACLVPRSYNSMTKYNKLINSPVKAYKTSINYIKPLSSFDLLFREKLTDAAVFCKQEELNFSVSKYELFFYELHLALMTCSNNNKVAYIPALADIISPNLKINRSDLKQSSFLYTKIGYIYNNLENLQTSWKQISRNLAATGVKLILKNIFRRNNSKFSDLAFYLKFFTPYKRIEALELKSLLTKLLRLIES